MSNNTTDPINYHYPFGAFSFLVIGLVVGLSNLLIGVSIAKYGALRQLNQYVLLMTLAFADTLNMCGYIAAGIYRLYVIFSNQMDTFLTARECLLRPHIIFWLIGEKFSHLMLIVISLDRLFLVAFPQFYLLQLPSPRYAVATVLAAFGLTSTVALLGVAAIASSSPGEKTEQAVCFFPPNNILESHDVLAKIYAFYENNISSAFAMASVVIFMAILPVYKWRNQSSGIPLEEAAHAASQKKMTRSLAISSFCTFSLLCVPFKLMHVAEAYDEYLIGWLMADLSMTNALANVAIYQLRHYEMRVALEGLFKGKLLPDVLSMWPKPGQVVAPSGKEGSKKHTIKAGSGRLGVAHKQNEHVEPLPNVVR